MTTVNIALWLGETSIAVSVLILLVLLIRKPFTRVFGARASYALWLAPAARLFLPELKVLPAPERVVEFLSAPIPVPSESFPVAISATPITEIPQSFDIVSLAAATALFIWAAVAFAWLSIKLEAQSRFMRDMEARSTPAPSAIARDAKSIAKGLGLNRTPRIRICNDETGPCVVGLFRPVVFLPAAFETTFTAREKYLALAHELSHLARGDMIATLAAIALQSLQWPNPLAHIAFRKFRADQEAACDAYVLSRCTQGSKAAGDYAAAIMKSVRASAHAPAYGLSLAHPVKERLMLLKDQKNTPLRILGGTAAAIAFVGVSLAGTASYGFQEDSVAKKEVRIKKKKRVTSKTTIHVDDDETMEISGVRNPGKIEYENENGLRKIRIYNRKGKLVSEKTYQPEDELPFETVTIKKKGGETQIIHLDGPENEFHAKRFSFSTKRDGSDDIDIDFVAPDTSESFVFIESDDDEAMQKWVMSTDSDMHFIHEDGKMECIGGNSDGPIIMEFSTDDDMDITTEVHEVVCIDGADADPKKRAEVLRTAIEHMEESAKREAQRREEVLERMRAELKSLEDKN